MSNVKPGDRAIVIKSESGNLGKIVLVIEKYDGRGMPPDNLPYLVAKHELNWIVESLGAPFNIRNTLTPLGVAGVGVCADGQLRRLDPPEEEQTGSDEGLSAPVKDSQTVEVHS